MSALCQKQTFGAAAEKPLFDHLVGTGDQHWRHGKAKCLGCLQVDYQIILVRCLHRQVGQFRTLEDTVNVVGSAPELLENIIPIRDQAASVDVVTPVIHCRQFVLRCEGDD
jgi:hypothetical protein